MIQIQQIRQNLLYLYSFVYNLPDDGLGKPKHVGGTLYIKMSIYY